MGQVSKLMGGVVILAILGVVMGCGDKGGFQADIKGVQKQAKAAQDPSQQPPPPGEVRKVSVTPVAEEETGLARLFTGKDPASLVANGSFEEWLPGEQYPAGWQFLVKGPTVTAERTITKHGNISMKLTGSTDSETWIQPVAPPDVEKVRGRTVLFGAWMYTSTPDKVAILVNDRWKKYHIAHPQAANKWELVTISVDLPADTDKVYYTVVLGPSTPPSVCYVDGMALFLR